MQGDSIGRLVARLLLALVLGMSAAAAHAQVGAVGEPVPVCVTRAQPGMDPTTLLHQRGGFDCTTPQIDFGRGDFWVRSAPLHRIDTRSPHEIRIASVWQDKITLYALYGDGRIYTFADDSHELSHHIQLGAIIQHQTPPSPVPLVRLLWHVEGSANLRGIVIAPRITDSYRAGQSNLKLGALYAGFVGMCLALLVYNLALWGALRYRFQLAYCAMVAALMGYAVSSSGALAWMIPELANNDRLRINYLLLGISAASAVAFARSFFEERIFSGWLRTASGVAMTAVLIPPLLLAIYLARYLAPRQA